jgi:uncharacterized protein YqjF (DUF2071 family)
LTTRRAFLTAEWRYLVMLNYDVDPAVLEPLVPAGTTLDRLAGRALVSIVGFRFLRTRVLGVPIPFHRDFDEVNLRFYVRRETADGEVRRGVTFVRELVPRAAIALVARVAYDEPYRAVAMRSVAPGAPTETPGTVSYAWRTSDRWQRVAATATGEASIPGPDDEATFVTEHYWGYTRRRSGATTEYEVAHPRWRVWPARDAVLDADVRGLYGAAFVDAFAAPPCSAFVAEGSAVTVYRPRSLGPAAGITFHRPGVTRT